MDTKEKTCEKCRFYLQHYIKTNHGFSTVSCGHCVNNYIHWAAKQRIRATMQGCERWEPMQIQIEERQKSFKENIEKIANYFESICKVLESDLKE